MTAELRVLVNLARAASAGAGDVSSLLGRLCASLGEAFAFDRVDAYRYVADHDEVVLLTGERRVVQAVADDECFADALATSEAAWRDGRLAVPLVVADGCIGFLAADCDQPSAADLDTLSAAGAWTAAMLHRALAHEELERLSRLKSQFIALASHELRAPAAVIHGVAKTVVAHAETLPPDRIASLHEALVEHTERMTRLIDELLDLSRLEAKVVEIERSSLPIRERAEEVVRTVAGERAEEVAIEIGDELRPMLDPVAFDRILGNLVTNALRYGRRPIRVRAAQNDRHFRLTVEDHGDGVAPRFVPHLFERFSREGRDGAPKGSGLGLSIAQAYAQAHGGQLFYEDAAPHGARFQLVLPSK
jgi:signal transduction histidine kinase